MSRQKGRREPPKPEQQAYVESLKKGRRGRARERARAAAAPGPSIVTGRRRWMAVFAGTFFLVFAFGFLLTYIAETQEGDPDAGRLALILSGVIAVMSVGVVAIISRAPKPMRATFATGPAALGVFLILGQVLPEPVTPMVVGFGLAGSLALRAAPGGTLRGRILAVLLGAVATGLIFQLSLEVALSIAPLMPYALPMIADALGSRRRGVSLDEIVPGDDEEEETVTVERDEAAG